MKKIVFVVPDMAGGGTEKVITLLCNLYIKKLNGHTQWSLKDGYIITIANDDVGYVRQ